MTNVQSELQTHRETINTLDAQLLAILSQRIDVVRKIGKLKSEAGLPARDEERWQQVLNAAKNKGEQLNLSADFVSDLYHLIHDYAVELEKSETGTR